MELVNLPALRFKQTETLSHTALSMAHTVANPCDVAIVFNAANAPFLPILRARRIPAAVHVDGLEWKRAKWGGTGRRYYQWAERVAVRLGQRLIADARGIRDYYRQRYGVDPTFIPYGAPIIDDPGDDGLTELGLERQGYHLVVSRMEPENNVDVIVEGYAGAELDLPLVVVGSAPHAARYSSTVRNLAGKSDVRFIGSTWDQTLLDQLYAGARLYLHGHSVGGTNPSLLRAMGAGAPVAAFDVLFNREVLGDTGVFFSNPADAGRLMRAAETELEETKSRGLAGRRRAAANYEWDQVADEYERLCRELIAHGR
jgi:glycosyltransferase involved in cell wall biosynthesis